MKTKTRKTTTSLAAAGLMAIGMAGLNAQTIWNGSAEDNDWHNELNWSNGLPDVGNIPVIQNAGDLVNLTQDVTATGGTFNLRSRFGTDAPATLNISANMNLGTNAFEIGSRFLNEPGGYYQGIVNQTAGEVTLGALRVSLRGSTTGAPPSEYNLSAGKLTVTSLKVGDGAAAAASAGIFRQTGGEVIVGGNFFLSENQGRGVYLMEDGTLDVSGGEFRVSERSLTNPIFHQTGGTVTMTNMGVSRIAWRATTSGSAIGTMILESGDFSWQSDSSYFTASERISVNFGTLTKYGAANVSFSTGSTTEPALMFSRGNGNGTLRAVIDQTGFDPIRVQSSTHAFRTFDLINANNSTLQVALDGGVMLSGTDTFQIVESVEVDEVRGSVTGSWSSLPASLWTVYTGEDGEEVDDRDVWGVQIELDAEYNRGTLNAATIGNEAVLTGPSSVGFIDLTNVNTGSLLQLRLGMDAASVGDSNLDDFIADLDAAGYSPQAFGNLTVVISLNPQANGAEYFAWDLSGYTSSGPLEIESITVVAIAQPRITSFTYDPADGSAEATIEGSPFTRFKLVEAADLDFSTPDQDPVPLLGATVGTLIDGFYLTTDVNGVATVQFNLGTGPATFVRAEETGVITLASFDFEADGQGFTPSGDWEWGTPDSDNGLVDGQVTGGNGGSTGAWATVLGDGGEPVNGGITLGADSILRSPDIDLTGVSGARLQFAAAVDALDGDILEVNVYDADGDTPLGTITPFADGFPADAAWRNRGPFPLPAAADNKTIYLEFRFLGTNAEYLGFYLDDVKISF